MESEKFCLSWNDFETNISAAFRELREEKDFFDVTLACDDNQIQAHKVIISACSPFFRNVLRRNPHQHPLLYLKGVKYKELLSVVNFMYMGEVAIAQEELESFLKVAEDLKVKGLTQDNTGGLQQEPQKTSRTKVSQSKATLPPPKRPRITRPAPAHINMEPAQSYHEETTEEELQQVASVKSEPSELHPQTSELPPQPTELLPQLNELPPQPSELPPQSSYLPEQQEQGTVGENESYAGEESRYQKSGVGAGPESVKGMKKIRSKITKQETKNKHEEPKAKHAYRAFAQAWQCEECKTIFSSRKYAIEHMQEYN